LGSGNTQEVTTARTDVAIIHDSFFFIDDQTSMENGFDPTSILNIYDQEVSGGLMMNSSTIISREMRPKLMCLKVYEEASIPWVIEGNEEEVFIREIHIDGGSLSI